MQPPADNIVTDYVPGVGPIWLVTALGVALLVINLGLAALMLVLISLE
jgi:hypothetical protein